MWLFIHRRDQGRQLMSHQYQFAQGLAFKSASWIHVDQTQHLEFHLLSCMKPVWPPVLLNVQDLLASYLQGLKPPSGVSMEPTHFSLLLSKCLPTAYNSLHVILWALLVGWSRACVLMALISCFSRCQSVYSQTSHGLWKDRSPL